MSWTDDCKHIVHSSRTEQTIVRYWIWRLMHCNMLLDSIINPVGSESCPKKLYSSTLWRYLVYNLLCRQKPIISTNLPFQSQHFTTKEELIQPPSRLQLHARSTLSSFVLPLQYALAKPLNEDSQNFRTIYSFIAAIFTSYNYTQ
jgi:hypothetical protein